LFRICRVYKFFVSLSASKFDPVAQVKNVTNPDIDKMNEKVFSGLFAGLFSRSEYRNE